MLYNSKEFANTADRKHYKLHENDALNSFSSIHRNYPLVKCGIFIDKDLSFLCTTPLRLYGPESIVVVRCPLKGFNQSVENAVESKFINFWKLNRRSSDLTINNKSAWYLQIQGELHVSDRKFAYLVVWLGEGKIKIERVERDDNFWDLQMRQKLTFFSTRACSKNWQIHVMLGK